MKKTDKSKLTEKTQKYWMLIVITLLFIFSIAQAIQIDNLEKHVESGIISGFFNNAGGQNNEQVVKQAPVMVGGC